MKRVVIADDAHFMRLSLKSMLEKNGFQVVGDATNGKEAVNLCMLHQPDIITMDITMPEMNGIDAIKEIRKFNRDVKILVISAMGYELFVYDAITAGASGFIVKPFKEEDLIKNLSKY